MKHKFIHEFEDESKQSMISFDYDEDIEEKFDVRVEHGVPVIYGNREAMLLMAKTFSKLGICNYEDGFHLHLKKDFDADENESLRIVLDNSLR